MIQSHHEILESLERELVAPDTRKSRDRMDEILDDDFEEYGSSGKHFRKSDVLNSSSTLRNYELSNFCFNDLAPGVTLVKYESLVSGHVSRRSSIWVQRGDQWRLLHHQATVVPNAT